MRISGRIIAPGLLLCLCFSSSGGSEAGNPTIKEFTKDEIEIRKLLQQAVNHANQIEIESEEDFKAIKNRTRRLGLLAEIAGAQFREGDEAGALKTIEHIHDDSYKGLALGEIASNQAFHGKLDDALKTIAKIKRPGMVDLAAREVAKVLEIAGNKRNAARFTQLINGLPIKILAWREIATIRAAAGDNNGAQEAISLAIALSAKIPLKNETIERWLAIGKTQEEIGNRQEALKLFQLVRNEILSLDDPENKTLYLNSLTRAQAEALNIEGALESFQLIPEGEKDVWGALYTDKGYLEIALALARSGKVEEARRKIAKIKGNETKTKAWAFLAKVQIKAGALEASKQSLEQALILSEKPLSEENWFFPEANSILALGAISEVQIIVKDYDGARATAEKIKTEIRNEILKNVVLAELEDGKSKTAIQTVQTMKDGSQKNEALRTLAKAWGKEGDRNFLLQVENFNSPFDKPYLLLGFAEGLAARKVK